jgi:hypothetical protein
VDRHIFAYKGGIQTNLSPNPQALPARMENLLDTCESGYDRQGMFSYSRHGIPALDMDSDVLCVEGKLLLPQSSFLSFNIFLRIAK